MTTEQEFRTIANNLVASMVGANHVDAWWTTANQAFDGRTPETQWAAGSDAVINYLMHHAFGGVGSR